MFRQVAHFLNKTNQVAYFAFRCMHRVILSCTPWAIQSIRACNFLFFHFFALLPALNFKKFFIPLFIKIWNDFYDFFFTNIMILIPQNQKKMDRVLCPREKKGRDVVAETYLYFAFFSLRWQLNFTRFTKATNWIKK